MTRKILVDADACPVKEIIVREARQRRIPVVMFIDVNHEINDEYSQVITVDQGRDSADYKLIASIETGDIVVTQDYGVAGIALAKKAQVIHQSGMIFDGNNIETLLNQRYFSQKQRKAGKKTQGPKKRTKQDDDHFEQSFRKLLDCTC